MVSLTSSWYQVRSDKDALRVDLERKAETVGESLTANAEHYLQSGDRSGLEGIVSRFSDGGHELLEAVGSINHCDASAQLRWNTCALSSRT